VVNQFVRLSVVAIVMVLAACGSDDTESKPPPTSQSTLTTAPSALTTTTTTTEAGPKLHFVAAGETLSGIAVLYELTVQQILDANPNLGDGSRISIAQQIVIPDIDNSEPSTTLAPLELEPLDEPDLPELLVTTSTTEPLATTTTAG